MFPNLYKSALKCGIDTFRNDGVYRGLYAGTVPALAANVSGKLKYKSLFFFELTLH